MFATSTTTSKSLTHCKCNFVSVYDTFQFYVVWKKQVELTTKAEIRLPRRVVLSVSAGKSKHAELYSDQFQAIKKIGSPVDGSFSKAV